MLNQMLVLPMPVALKILAKKVIVDGINSGIIALNPRGEKSTFLLKYIKRIKYLNNEYQICNAERYYHVWQGNTNTKNINNHLKKNMN